MKTLLIACEVLRPELEVLASDMRNPPPMNFLEQRLHDYPEKLRSAFQGLVDAFEQENDGPLAVLCGYGLCGRGLCGVHASRATLVFPKLHDCIPLLLGLDQKGANASSREGATYWISPGLLKYFLVPFHLNRIGVFPCMRKFGAAKAARMMKAENALLDNYKNACHIRWPEMGTLCGRGPKSGGGYAVAVLRDMGIFRLSGRVAARWAIRGAVSAPRAGADDRYGC
ncbi:MAG: DUF1638 domain-containing protein [Bilophila wadsworthia]